MNRFFVNDIGPDWAVIAGEDLKHLSSVLRLRKGEGTGCLNRVFRSYNKEWCFKLCGLSVYRNLFFFHTLKE